MKTTMRVLFTVFLFFVTTALVAQDPIVVAPKLYKKVFENDKVRVLEVNLKAGEKIAAHSHPAHVAYVVNPGKLRITDSAGKAMDAEPKAGEVIWFDPVTHSAENTGTTDLKIAVIELKEK